MMGRRGRKMMPSALKVLRGSYIKDPQKRNDTEPIAPDGKPRCPSHLNHIAKTRWNHMCDMLEKMHLQTPANLAALEIYCRTYATSRAAIKYREEHGLFCDDAAMVQRLIKDCDEIMMKVLMQFGFTPSARASLHVDNFDQAAQIMMRVRD